MQTPTPKASPALLERIDRLAGCSGHWLLIRDGEPERDCSHQWHQSPTDHLQTCLAERWRNVSLGFVPSYCGWSDYSNTGLVGKANFNVLTDPASTPDPHGGILTVGYGWNGEGVVLDLLTVPADVLEAVESLEDYPLLSEEEHSSLEIEAQGEAWESWAASDWRDLVRDQLAQYCPAAIVDANQYGPSTAKYWADDQLDAIPDDQLEQQLRELFSVCLEWSGEGWSVEDLGSGAYLKIDKVARGIDRSDLVHLTGLPLLAPDQEWRREPYPWPDGSRDPLEPALV